MLMVGSQRARASLAVLLLGCLARMAGATTGSVGRLEDYSASKEPAQILAHLRRARAQRAEQASEGQPLGLELTIINAGEETAVNVTAELPNWPGHQFATPLPSINIESLASGEVIAKTFAVMPRKPFRLAATETALFISYRSSDSGQMRKSRTTGATVDIMSAKQLERNTRSNVAELTQYGLLCCWSVAVPFAVWLTTRSMFSQKIAPQKH
mmetsp:Transcript_11743/g.29876  ORF Transcript_11743/g.29876 Transcript_11743/m.29876 type:complete len:212 (+) Transcript_11743:133-768(+)